MSFNPFPIGTQLHVETCFGDKLTGEVLTYEHSYKMLILRCDTKDNNGKISHNQCIINLDFCKDLDILQEAKKTVEQPTPLNILRLDQRLQQTLMERESFLSNRNEHATERGMQLFELLSKNFGNTKVAWQKQKIVVLHQLSISPPYRLCDIKGAKNIPKLLNFVNLLVKKFNKNAAIGDKADNT